jgi:transcriptional regulator with PAS, ATPase and Fis domain
VLEDKKVTPIGATLPVDVDIRLIAATNSALEEDVKAGRFRADLFYRLNVIPVVIPPLRERTEDIPLLVNYFVESCCQRSGAGLKKISAEAMHLLVNYPWPGNVRELENTIERAILLNRSDAIEVADFPEKLSQAAPTNFIREADPATPTLESIEKAYIHYVMTQTDGKKAEAARILGIDSSTLYRKIDRYGLKELFGSKAKSAKEGE